MNGCALRYAGKLVSRLRRLRFKPFGEKPVLVVKRFDRLWKEDVLYRLPQEDLCQALGLSPNLRYESERGPGILRILKFLNSGRFSARGPFAIFQSTDRVLAHGRD